MLMSSKVTSQYQMCFYVQTMLSSMVSHKYLNATKEVIGLFKSCNALYARIKIKSQQIKKGF